jgi:hypothetical protein
MQTAIKAHFRFIKQMNEKLNEHRNSLPASVHIGRIPKLSNLFQLKLLGVKNKLNEKKESFFDVFLEKANKFLSGENDT